MSDSAQTSSCGPSLVSDGLNSNSTHTQQFHFTKPELQEQRKLKLGLIFYGLYIITGFNQSLDLG